MKNLFVILAFFSMIFTAYSVTKQLSTFELFCVYRYLPVGDQLSGSYVVSGASEKNVNFNIYSPSNQLVFKIEKEREGQFSAISEENGEFRTCWRNTQRETTFVQFEIYANMSEPKTSLMNQELINGMDIELTHAIRQLRLIRTNQGYQEFRERIHSTNLVHLESRIGWTTFFKVLAVVSIGVGQAYILTTLFKKKLIMSSV